jgi:hypothetical protein
VRPLPAEVTPLPRVKAEALLMLHMKFLRRIFQMGEEIP